MFARVVVLVAFSLLSITMVGCGKKYQPKALDMQAKRVALSQQPPQGCTYIGEAEGMENDLFAVHNGGLVDNIRGGVLNDLRNNAAHLANPTRRLVVVPLYERCYQLEGGWSQVTSKEINCQTYKNTFGDAPLSSMVIKGSVYDCGAW